MDNDTPRIPIEKLWEATLAELQLTLARATFDELLKNTKPTHLETDGTLIVVTKSSFNKEWLDERLKRPIAEALERQGHTTGHEFIVSAAAAAFPLAPLVEVAKAIDAMPERKASLKIMDFDPSTRGWVQTPAYATQFWLPYLGAGPFNVWQVLRSFASDTQKWPTLQTLADIVCGGNRQTLTGRKLKNKKKEEYWHAGWLELLDAEKIVWYYPEDHEFQVLERLPLLTPKQLAKLSRARQGAHKSFLTKTENKHKEWKQLTKQWQQLTLDTLSEGPTG